MEIPKRILPTIVFSQFAGTSLWFAGNAILPQLQQSWSIPESSVAHITSAVMLGFIVGTFLFAFSSIADRYQSTAVFLVSSVLGAVFNASILFLPPSFILLMMARFLTGIALAGIYPVGMKIASDWFKGNLGKALGYLVGALVLGSAFPHLLNYSGSSYTYEFVLLTTSTLAILGGLSMYFFVGDGPFQAKGAAFNPAKVLEIFKNKGFHAAAFGYFGHMWELYAFWAFLPIAIQYYNELNGTELNASLWTFLIMAVGVISCVLGGLVSIKKGSAKVAFVFLAISGALCLVSPFFYDLSTYFFLGVLLLWGFAVIGDSAQFSTLNAQKAPPAYRGTALTIVVSIGFFITIPSIQLLGYINEQLGTQWILLFLAMGPIIGLFSTRKLIKTS